MKCREIRELLPAYADGHDADLVVRRHLSGCDQCRFELDRYIALRSALSDLRTEIVEPAPGLLLRLQAIASDPGGVDRIKTHVVRNKRTYAGVGLAVAGAAGAALWRARRSRPMTV